MLTAIRRSPQSTGLSLTHERRLRRKLRLKVPSEPWLEACFIELHEAGQTVRRYDSRAFPPGGRETKMRWCRSCGRYTPPSCIRLIEHSHVRNGLVHSATLICEDCHIADDLVRYGEFYNASLHLTPLGSASIIQLAAAKRASHKR